MKLKLLLLEKLSATLKKIDLPLAFHALLRRKNYQQAQSHQEPIITFLSDNKRFIWQNNNTSTKVSLQKKSSKGNQLMQPDRVEQKQKNVMESHQGNKKWEKPAKQNKPVPLEEQVVYSLILSIHGFSSQLQKNQTEGNESTDVKEETYLNRFKLLERNGIKRSDLSDIVYNKIRPIPFSSMNDIRMKLRASLGKVYLKRKAKQSQIQQLQINLQKTNEELYNQSINAYLLLAGLLREASVPTPIQEGFYEEYNAVWQEFIENVRKENSEQNAELQKQYQKKMLEIWHQIPHQSLNKHLQSFGLKQPFSQLNSQMMIKHFSSLLVDNKIQQCCTYYETYFIAKNLNQQFLIELKELRIFEDEVLIPKITKSDHIFSNHVLSLFRSNSLLKERLLNSVTLDPAVGVRIVDLLKEDGRKYMNIYMFCLKQHYKSIIYDHKHWWIVEDKLSFNSNFIQWYSEDLIKAVKGIEKNDRVEKIAKEIKDVQNLEDLELSLLLRNKIIDFEHERLKDKQFTNIRNPLYERDRFDCSQLIIEEIDPEEIEQSNTKYLRFEEFGVLQKDIKLIDKIDESFEEMCSTLLSYTDKPIGFDTEFRCVSTKYEQQGVALIQLSTEKYHYIIDFLKLQNSTEFNKFIIELLCNKKYIKVGHTISSDIKYLTYTLHLPQNMFIESFVDINQIFKILHPNEKFSSLSYLCLKFLKRKLSKYEQRSNWNRRPLRKAQVHYAALDAFVCVLIYNELIPEYKELLKHGKLYKAKQAVKQRKQIKQKIEEKIVSKIQQKKIEEQKPSQLSQIMEKLTIQESEQTSTQQTQTNYFVGDIYRSQSLVYHRKFQKILSNQSPKFLVDNMLKKLSAIMRNCGLDAEYIAVRDYQLAGAIAQKENRIIVTRDAKFFQRKDNKLPIYLIKQKTDSQKMFQEITQFFKIDLTQFTTLSRCVKCNGPELIVIDTEQAKIEIKFKYQDSTVTVFWRCTKCKQIYWEGGQFQRAKQKYTNLKKI